ncbi:hypothetical protein COO91_04409 [Nostoc flagelliforme CCNUN1]|uniref:Uncharacterized protein n=1 Tax=Nostoc flagelliforme CCNUN1 TaxID=2038116 RepID=A0A2K8SSL1_9NOSO|nr:hypothetical protein COO91_04409 [Nostoc flagelliforme CCNUN1]
MVTELSRSVGYAYAKISVSSLYNLVIVWVLRNKNAARLHFLQII